MGNNINHPDHYNAGNIEVIAAIEDWGLGCGFNRGNAIKYIARAGLKSSDTEIEDLCKAKWYIEREIERLGKHYVIEKPSEDSGFGTEDADFSFYTPDVIIKRLKNNLKNDRDKTGDKVVCDTRIIDMVIGYLEVHEQIAFERNTAVSQLDSIGKAVGEDMDDVKALLDQFDSVCESCNIQLGKEVDDG